MRGILSHPVSLIGLDFQEVRCEVLHAVIIITLNAHFLEKLLPYFYYMPLTHLSLFAWFYHFFVIYCKVSQIVFGSKWNVNSKSQHTCISRG